MTRYALDSSTRRLADSAVVIGGSPLRLFRLSASGGETFDRIAAGADVGDHTVDDPTGRLLARLVDAGVVHPQPTTSTFTTRHVTVVIPALGVDAATIVAMLETVGDVGAVIVVDDGTDTPIGGVPGAQVLRLRTNSGPAVARNGGLGAVTTPLVAFLDTDVVPTGGWLDPLLAHFADERVGLVAPRVASRPGSGRLDRYEQRHSSLDLGVDPGRIAPGTRLSFVPAAALLARTAALREINGFDRALRVGEDVDAVWRLVAAGWRCRYEPAAQVHHRPRTSWRRFVEQRVAYGSSASLLAQRHPGALAPLRVSGWSLGAWGLLAMGHPLAALGLAAGTAGALVRKLPGVPAAESVRLAALGHVRAGRQIAEATRRAWWPAALAGSLVSKSVRRIAAAAALLSLADGGPARLADDVAYGAGVWKGVLATKEWGPLRPDLRSWPGRSAAFDRSS